MARGHRSGRGGGGRHRGARQAQPTAAPPSGDALRVELRASPDFFDALKGRECPAAAAEGSSSSGPSPMGTSVLQMEQWKDLDRLLGWFRDGIKADPLAELAFSTKLTKTQRASVHGTATAVGLGGLGTASRGVGEGRCVVVLAKQRAVRPELSERQDHQAFWTWRWAGQRGLQVSRDEVAEMLLGGGLTPELQAIWDEQSALQKAVQQLCGAVAAGDGAAVAAAADAQPRLLQEGVFDVQSGVAPLHLAAREGRAELVELLLSKGAAVDGLDGHGWTPLQVARKYEQSDAEGVLLRAGARDPDKGKSILDRPAAAAAAAPPAAQPEPPLANGTQPAPPAGAAAASGPLSDAGSQDVYIDSVASVCGTERDNLAAEVGSNADDYADPQYQAHSASLPSSAIQEGDEAKNAEAESARAQAEAVALAAKAAAEAEAAAAEAAAEEAAREAAAAAAATAASAFAAARASAEEEAGMEEEGTAEEDDEEEEDFDDDEAEEGGLSADEEGELAEEAAGEAKISAVRAFSAALAAAEAAEAAAAAAEAWPGEEGAQRAAAFRREAEAAVAAAAAAAVVVGDALDGVLPPRQGRAPPPPPPSSAASVCGSDATARSALPEASDFGSGPLSSSGSAPAQPPSVTSAAASQRHAEAQGEEVAAPAQQAAAAAGEAALAGSAGAAAAAAAAAASAAGQAEVAQQAPAEAAEGAAGDVHAAAASAAEHTATAGKGAAAAASWAASRARAELEALAPEWSQWFDQKAPEVAQWVQEHPGSVIAGAGLIAAGLAALLYGTRRR